MVTNAVVGNQKLQQLKSKPFIALQPNDSIIKFVSIWEIAKIVVNRNRLEITILYVSKDDKDIVKFRTLEDLENAIARICQAYSSVFLKP